MRTPLMSALRALFRDHKASKQTGIPVDELRDMRAEAKPSRRKFLAAAALGAGALALPRAARAAGGAQPSIGIIGGGIAGLTCALNLADAGISSTVYEASGRIGGRMFTNRTNYFANNQITEWGGELIDTGHRTVRDLCARFNLTLDNLLKAQPNGSRDLYRFGGAYYPATTADDEFGDAFDVIEADADAAGYPTTFDAFTDEGAQLDAMSVRDYIASRIPGGLGSKLGKLLDVAYNIEYGAETRDQSALNLLYLLAYQPNQSELAVFGESDEKFHIRGGNQQLPEAMAAALGSSVVTGEKLVKLKETANGRYRITLERGHTTREIVHDYVVLAIPFAVLAGVDYAQAGFDDLKKQAIRDQGRGRNGKLQVQFSSRDWLGTGAWPGKANGGSFSDTGYQASWEATRAQAGSSGVLVLYSGGDVTNAMKSNTAFNTLPNALVQQDVNRGLSQLAPVFPGLVHNGKATQSLPHKSDFFKASYSYYQVGQYTLFAGYERKRQGGVLFCGEHTSTDYQGFMEGGADEGARAARKLINLI